MRGTALLDELLGLAKRQGLAVRRESMSRGAGTGGFCVLNGTPTLFVDDRASVDAQIEVVASVLRRYDWSDVFLAPTVRALLGAGSDEGRAAKSEG